MQIKKGKMTVTDTCDRLIETEQGITCGCGNVNLTRFMHIDAMSYHASKYICCCGNNIEIYCER